MSDILLFSKADVFVALNSFRAKVDQLERENAALRQALDAQMQYQRDLRDDRDRLDYMEECSVDIELGLDETGAMKVAHIYIDRAAIDAARAKEGGAS